MGIWLSLVQLHLVDDTLNSNLCVCLTLAQLWAWVRLCVGCLFYKGPLSAFIMFDLFMT